MKDKLQQTLKQNIAGAKNANEACAWSEAFRNVEVALAIAKARMRESPHAAQHPAREKRGE